MTSEKMHDKLRKLKAMADSAKKIGNEAEAQAFAEMLTKLMAAHNVEFTDVEWEREKQVEATKLVFKTGKKKLYPWEICLARIIAHGNFCEMIIYGNLGFQFVGFQNAVEATLETMKYLHPAAKRIAQAEYDKKYNALYAAKMNCEILRGYRKDFLLGFVDRLKERYDELAEKLRSASAGCAMIRLTDAFVIAKKAVQEMKGLKQVQTRIPVTANRFAYAEGRAKANEMNVGGPALK